ncbi:uncharacterized protein LOC109824108 [Asparagus officinalis]|uniref:uncharacterized protein LOC109824108 n=1 Tax=Asparagus officinalis TaxID=4686 RepID=UPI00098DF8D8|nr:uncharacterized protein LOC109824108 [Asparagus officinalis]
MSTESVGSFNPSPFEPPDPTSPSQEQHKTQNFSPNTPDQFQSRRKLIICYSCNREGHYSTTCPNKNRGSPGASPSKALFPKCPQKYPELECRACGQVCVVRTSRTEKNPDRDFYACPRGNMCNMFQWCDEVGKIRPTHMYSPVKPVKQHDMSLLKNPECPCTAGPCRIEKKQSGRKYYACHLKMGQGCCNHFEWCDGQGDGAEMNMAIEGQKGMGTDKPAEVNLAIFPSAPSPSTNPRAEHEANCSGSRSSRIRGSLSLKEWM